METTIAEDARLEECSKGCRDLASWLVDRASMMEKDITDVEVTLTILDRYVGRVKANVDKAGWVPIQK